LGTRDKIVETSRKLFNDNGFGAVKLYSISQTLGISRGNLTYYFKTKEALLETHAENMALLYTQKLKSIQFPSWENTYNATIAFHEIQRHYAFIFSDKQVLQTTSVQEQISRMYTDDIDRQLSMIAFSVEIGNMQPEKIPGTYNNLVKTLWSNSFFWNMSEVYQKKNENVSWDKIAWSLILPHFTEKGIQAFKKHFGEAYFQSLGESFKEHSIAFNKF